MSDAAVNPDGPREWHNKLERMREELERTQIERERMHSQLVRLQDALGARSFEEALTRAQDNA